VNPRPPYQEGPDVVMRRLKPGTLPSKLLCLVVGHGPLRTSWSGAWAKCCRCGQSWGRETVE